MKLTVLGGAAAGGNTGSGCSGYLLQSGDSNLVVDLGPGTLPELRKHVDFRILDAIIISHWHVDHFLDLAAFRFAAAYNPRPLEGQIPLYMPPNCGLLFRRFGASLPFDEEDFSFFDQVFSILEFDPCDIVRAGAFTIRFQPTIHFVPCWALRIADASGIQVGYTADTGPTPGLAGFFDGVDLLVAESTSTEHDPHQEQPGHLTGGDAGSLASNCDAQTLLLTHMWEEFGFDIHRTQARERFSGEILIARPGLQVEVGKPAT